MRARDQAVSPGFLCLPTPHVFAVCRLSASPVLPFFPYPVFRAVCRSSFSQISKNFWHAYGGGWHLTFMIVGTGPDSTTDGFTTFVGSGGWVVGLGGGIVASYWVELGLSSFSNTRDCNRSCTYYISYYYTTLCYGCVSCNCCCLYSSNSGWQHQL